MVFSDPDVFKNFITDSMLQLKDPGPLLFPIQKFQIYRDESSELILETVITEPPQETEITERLLGDIRENTEIVTFLDPINRIYVAKGVIFKGQNTKISNAGKLEEIKQISHINSIFCQVKDEHLTKFTIDWVENLDSSRFQWKGSLKHEEIKQVTEIEFGRRSDKLTFQDQRTIESSSTTSIFEITVENTRIFIGSISKNLDKNHKNIGFILYDSNKNDEFRRKIVTILSFLIGRYLVYISTTKFDSDLNITYFKSVSPIVVNGYLKNFIPFPAPLGESMREIDERILSNMVNSIFIIYEKINFDSFFWSYWHAICAPIHMAAGHFGAIIEALQRAYIENEAKSIETKIVPDEKEWNDLADKLIKSVKECKISSESSNILISKIRSNFNQKSNHTLFKSFFDDMNLDLGDLELLSWKRRNSAAHGGMIEESSIIDAIRQNKILKILIHRIIIYMTGICEYYYDDYTIGHKIRRLKSSINTEI